MSKEINQKPKVTVVIPAYNEERNIEKIIKEVKPFCDNVIVSVAKKSKDQTANIAKQIGVKVIIDHGFGKGDGIRSSLDYLEDESIVVFIDGDGSHIASDIPSIVQPIIDDKAEMVIGSRFLGGSEELHGDFNKFLRMFFSMCIAQIINWRFKTEMQDTQNGYRAFKVKALKDLNLTSNHTEIETEMCMKCIKKGYRIIEVPSRELKRFSGKSNISILRHGKRYAWTVLKNIF
ncbi:glycosyltransferase [Candidatus Woesearchaeota archaeon]|nr:glycosyltransferase [Candidatus Woesearchaeota archaeon]